MEKTSLIEKPSLATEALRAFYTLQCCWFNNEEIYLEQGCLHCGSAATYLIYFTDTAVQKLMLSFIQQYNCHNKKRLDLLDLPDFEDHYNDFLETLERAVNRYAREHQNQMSKLAFEQVESIFERAAAIAC
ncbi:hypothetical protein [Acinetobacter larvae]|uniref:Uncharacterized protein n=1 Tax=Acinetobacter larvae TaxID=1789224 RepID=A0A1B2M0X2_9GAMM|nr:hypothetical protein [Acinetobacter larvae]AOA58856.1 hypothetical protein BFG52_11155 [Acinetobacter larvae]